MTNTAKLFSTLSEARERLNAIIEHSFDGIFIRLCHNKWLIFDEK